MWTRIYITTRFCVRLNFGICREATSFVTRCEDVFVIWQEAHGDVATRFYFTHLLARLPTARAE